MNELQSRLCQMLGLGLAECARLSEEPTPPLEVVDDLASAMENLPKYVYDWRRLSLASMHDVLRRHRSLHPSCPHDYGALMASARVPSWHVWNHRRVREESVVGDDRLNEAQLLLLAMEHALFVALKTAAWEGEASQVRELGAIAGAMPEVGSVTGLADIQGLPGPTGPFAARGCPHWKVFQPLTIPTDEVIKRYLR